MVKKKPKKSLILGWALALTVSYLLPLASSSESVVSGGWGSHIRCDSRVPLTGICTGGSGQDCSGSSHKLWCDSSQFEFQTNTYTYQAQGDFGTWLYCDSNEIVAGICASGGNKDCSGEGGSNSKFSHKLWCGQLRSSMTVKTDSANTQYKCCWNGVHCACDSGYYPTAFAASGGRPDVSGHCGGYTGLRCQKVVCRAGYNKDVKNCPACPAGQWSNANGSCQDCPAGRYSSSSASASCTRCSAGYFQSLSGQEECHQVSAGYYASGTGNTQATRCDEDKYSYAGASSCSTCPSGTEVSSGQSRCDDINECSADHDCPGNSECINVVKNEHSTNSAAGFFCRCAAGYEVDGDPGERDGTNNIQCNPSSIAGTILLATPEYMTIRLTTVDEALENLQVAAYRYETLKSLEPLSNGITEELVSTLTRSSGYLIADGIDPGTKYKFEFRSPGLTEALGSVQGWSTCECQGYSDAPTQLTVTQTRGRVVFEFLDNSMCEDGFAFSRRPFPQSTYYVVCGNPENVDCLEEESAGLRLAGIDELHEVRCCSENNDGRFAAGVNTCNGLWITSNFDDTGCYWSKDYETAFDLCETAGARLCTKDELLDCAKGGGCQHDRELIWSSTPSVAGEVSFAPVYYYAASAQCNEKIEPGLLVSDDLAAAQLIVGNQYEYCVRAVGAGNSGVKYSSAEKCNVHDIAWEASIDGIVTLDPNAGSLPVEDVRVEWELIASDGSVINSGSEMTNHAGKFQIAFQEHHNTLDNNNYAEVHLLFEKTEPEYSYIACGRGTESFCPNDENRYASLDELHEVRCCSDTSGGDFTYKGDGCDVWGASSILSAASEFGGSSGCYRQKTYSQAMQICELGGGRLCTKEEVENSCVKETGCYMDAHQVWTSTVVGGLGHRFLCNQQSSICSGTEAKVYLKHLDFDVPFNVVDDTSVAFTGKIVVGGTGDDELAENGQGIGDGCPIIGATVCLKDKFATGLEVEGVCVETDSNGEYSVPAMVGTTVLVDVQYENHTFLALDSSEQYLYDQGIYIEAGKYYTNYNFQDVTTANLYVDVVGGLCDKLIGEATIEFQILGCPAEWTRTEQQASVSGVYQVPASLVEVRLTTMHDIANPTTEFGQIRDHFLGDVRLVDLRDQEESQDFAATNSSMNGFDFEEEENNQFLVRFQYDGTLKPSLQFINNYQSGTCTSADYRPSIPAGVTCDSFHVLNSMERYNWRLKLEYEILPEPDYDLKCDIVSDELQVLMVNGLGLIPGDDTLWSEYASLTEDALLELSHCDQPSGGCLLQIEHDECRKHVTCGGNLNQCANEENHYAGLDEPHEVRCCSDTSGGDFTVQRDGCSVWGASAMTSAISVFGGTDGCYTDKTYSEAFEICELAGGRLCTKEEVESGCTKYTGCDFNNHLVWTSTTESLCTKSSARAVDQVPGFLSNRKLRAGPPQTSQDASYLKYLTFQYEQTDHQACVLIKGLYAVHELQSVSLPTHEPLLVIRDPPGGMSYASYKNVQVTLALESFQKSHFAGTESDGVVAGGLFWKSGSVFGPPMSGLYVSLATKEASNEHGAELKLGGNILQFFGNEDKEWSGQFSTTWSYQTSDDAFAAGRNSDTFMVPNLNVKYTEVIEILWNATTCTGTAQTDFIMNLEAKSSKQALSYVSVYDVETYIIPKFVTMIAAIDAENTEELQALQDGLEGWNNTLQEYDATSSLGVDDLPKAKDWFSGWVREHASAKEKALMYGEGESNYDGVDHWSALLPKAFYDKAEPLEVSQLVGDTAGDLKETYTIEFSGGGGLMEFHLEDEYATQVVQAMGGTYDNSDFHQHLKSYTNLKLTFTGAFKKADFAIQQNDDKEFSHKRTTSDTSSTEIAFVLGDGDPDDHFVVDIYTDPRYGTFLFKTTSGVSLCMHEDGTMPGALPGISLSKSPSAPVLPDAEMVFQLMLQNRGSVPYRFDLYVSQISNTGNLLVKASGNTLLAPMTYDRIEGDDVIFTTVTVSRGPALYEYPPLEIGFRLACDEVPLKKSEDNTVTLFNDLTNQKIVFAEPCPGVHWSNLEDGYTITINIEEAEQTNALELTVFNPDYMLKSYEEAMSATRLKIVALMYRDAGDFKWERYAYSYDTNGELEMEGIHAVKIDFARDEDIFGYAKANWEYGYMGLPDGVYELLVRTECDEISGPLEFNQVSDVPLLVVIDRQNPKLHGYPTPKSGNLLYPGDEVAFLFDEPILCEKPYRFSLHVAVEGVEAAGNKLRSFDTDDLNVVCRENKISFTFDQTNVVLDDLMGKSMVAVLSDVYDVAGNPYLGEGNRNKIIHTFAHATVEASDTTFLFDVTVENICTDNAGTYEGPHDYHYVVCGNINNNICLVEEPNGMRLASSDEIHEVRCCAETNVHTDFQHTATNNNCDGVWGSSCMNGAIATFGGDCCYQANFMDAVAICEASGARLCTKHELESGCTMGSGCGYDEDLVWSSTVEDGAAKAAIADYMGLEDASRIGIESSSCIQSGDHAGDLSAQIQVFGQSARRLEEAADSTSAVDLARRLVELSTEESPIRILKAKVILGETDNKLQKKQAMLLLAEHTGASSNSFAAEAPFIEMQRIVSNVEKQQGEMQRMFVSLNQMVLTLCAGFAVVVVFLLVAVFCVLGNRREETSPTIL